MKHIYVYTIQTYIDNGSGWIKVGETIRDVDQRIGEQDNTSNAEPLIKIDSFEIPDVIGDEDIHRILRNMGYKEVREDVKREWFEIKGSQDFQISEIRAAAQLAAKNPEVGRIELSLTPNQYEMLELALDAFDRGDYTVLAELCPRFGKTVWMLALFSVLQKEKMLVIASYWLSALPSFKKDVARFSQFSNIVYVDSSDFGYEEIVSNLLREGKKVVVGVSLHRGGNGVEIKKESVQYLREYEPKIVFVDEADFGAWRENQVELVEYLLGK